MLILTVNIGNTHIQLGLFTGNALRHTWRIASQPIRTADEYALLLRGLMGDGHVPAGAIMCSVVPALEKPMAQAIERQLRIWPIIMDHDTPTGLINGYDHPAEVGMDRLANAAGAHYFHGAPVMVLDFGTALTLDYLSPGRGAGKKPIYVGGAILPGIEMATEALARGTAKLPQVTLGGSPRVLGRTTEESIRSGLSHGYCGAIQMLVERAWEEIGQSCPVLATGGDSTDMPVHMPFLHEVNPDLTLFGLRQIYGINRDCPMSPRQHAS